MTTTLHPAGAEQPWQLELFGMTLKKTQTLDLLLPLLDSPDRAERLLLLANGARPELMAAELGCSRTDTQREIEMLENAYPVAPPGSRSASALATAAPAR